MFCDNIYDLCGVTRFDEIINRRGGLVYILHQCNRVPSHHRSTIKLRRHELNSRAAAAAPSLLIITSQHKSQLRATTTRKCTYKMCTRTRRNDDGGVKKRHVHICTFREREWVDDVRSRARPLACVLVYIGPTNDDSVLRQLIITTHTLVVYSIICRLNKQINVYVRQSASNCV